MSPDSETPSDQIRILVTLVGAVFAPMLGSGIVAPLLPVYAEDFGATGFFIGLIFASFSISRSLLLPYFSRLSDRRGRRKLLLIGLLAHFVCSIGYIFSNSTLHLTLVRLLHGASAALVWPIAAAYVGDITPPGKEGRYMGWLNLGVFGGLAGGPFLGGVLKDLFGMEAAFLAMGGITLLGFGLTSAFLPVKETRLRSDSRPLRTLAILKRYPAMRGLFIFRLASALCISAAWAFQPLYLKSRFGMSASTTGMLISLNVALAAALQPFTGRVADAVSRRGLILTAGVIQAVSLIYLPLTDSMAGLLAVNLGIGLAGGIGAPALQAVVTELGRDAKMMGALTGALFTAQSLGMLIGPLLVGSLYQGGQFELMFWVTGGLVGAGLIPILVYLKPQRPIFYADRPAK